MLSVGHHHIDDILPIITVIGAVTIIYAVIGIYDLTVIYAIFVICVDEHCFFFRGEQKSHLIVETLSHKLYYDNIPKNNSLFYN